jgi:single-strand DNA-binding protein
MNKVIMMGRLTKENEMKSTNTGKMYLKNSLAVDRRGKKGESDFVNIIAWDKTADFINNWFSKGKMILIIGHIATGSYTKQDGTKVYTTDIVVDEAYFSGEKRTDGNNNKPASGGFNDINSNGEYEELPF